MFRWSFLVLCLIVAALTATAAVHVNEFAAPNGLECSGYVHSDGDGDQSQVDADKAGPHHHGDCHGAFSLLPRTGALERIALRPEAKVFVATVALGRWLPGPDLRPPIA